MRMNKYGSNNISELKRILVDKEEELKILHEKKTLLDKRAMRKANVILSMGAIIMFSQFTFITLGTTVYYSWDTMEPIAYLMGMANFSVAFTYYFLK